MLLRTATNGTPRDEPHPRMPPIGPARRRALRAVPSALAGGGMTAAALGAGGVASALAGQPTETVTLPAPPAAETTPTATTPPPATTAPAPTTTAPTTTATTP